MKKSDDDCFVVIEPGGSRSRMNLLGNIIDNTDVIAIDNNSTEQYNMYTSQYNTCRIYVN